MLIGYDCNYYHRDNYYTGVNITTLVNILM